MSRRCLADEDDDEREEFLISRRKVKLFNGEGFKWLGFHFAPSRANEFGDGATHGTAVKFRLGVFSNWVREFTASELEVQLWCEGLCRSMCSSIHGSG